MQLLEPAMTIADSLIPSLPDVLNPTELCRHLENVWRFPWRWSELRDAEVRVLRMHTGKRCTFQLTLRTATQVRAVVGKVYAQEGLSVYQAMLRLSDGGFGPDAEFSVPEPLIFVPAMQLVLQEKVEGASAEELFLTGNVGNCALAAERSARWLVKFHNLGPKAGPELRMCGHLAALERWSNRIAELGEPLAGMARRLFQRLELAADLEPAEMCAGHGDFKPQHVILANGRTITCDWDRFDVADPWRDVARFMIAIKRLALRHLGSMGGLDDVADRFLKTYCTVRRACVDRHLPFYMAATCMQYAKYDMSGPIACWREEIPALLNEGLRVLEAWR